MPKRSLKLGVVAVTALAAAMPLVATQAAYADYNPTSGDIVNVGSDTLQYMMDFVADGDAYGDAGYNNLGNKNKLVSIDAVPDQTARLAFGADGQNGTGNGGTVCAPTTGSTAGTGNLAPGASATPCILNPTVVLRAGAQAVQRPNGSGSGFNALAADITAGTNTINFSRASAARGSHYIIGSCGTSTVPCVDSIVVGSEDVPMIAGTTTNAVALTATQLGQIYSASSPNCKHWTDYGGSSPDQIIPIIPQSGSGTRAFFETSIGVPDGSIGNCVQVSEENDPTAIGTAAIPADAISPMSSGRLNMYLGLTGAGTRGKPSIGGYFLDPTCPYDSTASGCTQTYNGNTVPAFLSPPVQVIGKSSFDPPRDLYIYFRNADITSTKKLQPGTQTNWLRTLLYDPCLSTDTGCVTQTNQEGQSVQYGPAGPPFIDSSQGFNTILDAGVTPVDPVAPGEFVPGGQ